MLSIRSLARTAPRNLSRIASKPSISRLPATRPSALLKLSQGTILRPSPLARHGAAAAFSTGIARRAPSAGETDAELSAKLVSELQFEEEAAQEDQMPASVKDFLDNSPFELEDVAGKEVVKLTRTFGDEKITVKFSIADLNDYEAYDEDRAQEDEDFEDSLPDEVKSQEKQAAEGEEGYDSNSDGAAAPCRLSIVVEKPGKTAGALHVLANAQDGAIMVDNVYYYEDAKQVTDDAASRADVYPGPGFGTLDEDLQLIMERYLEERGITQALAVFAPDYMDVKEQQEYVRWLNNVKNFIDA